MSLLELTRNSVQSGLSAHRWLNLCKSYVSKNRTLRQADVSSDISNSVLILFSDYPGDPTLQAYLKCAVQDGLLPLPVFVWTFLSAARSPSMHVPSTLDMLCKVALDCHYSSGMPPMGSIVAYTASLFIVLETALHAMALLKTAHRLPITPYHPLTTSASELLILLLSCIDDFSQITTSQALVQFMAASELLQEPRLAPDAKHVLETFALSLSYLVGDDAKAAREAQMMHSVLGKGDAVGPNSESDIVSCSLLLQSLVIRRVSEFGAGDTQRAVALLIALVRWASWAPKAFYTQLLLSAVTCVAQEAVSGAGAKEGLLWRAFVVGRLPLLLINFEQAVELEGTSAADWRHAMHLALAPLLQEQDLLVKCNSICEGTTDSVTSGSAPSTSHLFIGELLHKLFEIQLVDQSFMLTAKNTLQYEFHPRIQTEAQEHGMDVETYIDSRLATETSMDDIASFVEKSWRDPCSHSALAEIIRKKFASYHSPHDIEALGRVCKILTSYDPMLEIVSLHLKLSDLVTRAITILQDYDCETLGDPQTAVSHLGDVVLFVQCTMARYNLSPSALGVLDEKRLSSAFLNSPTVAYRLEDLKGEDLVAFNTWYKALFDVGSEGIEDSILRSTRPRSLLRISATIFSCAISVCAEDKMEKELLNNGISYFLGPLLNWTLTGVIRVLLTEIHNKNFVAPIHLEVLRTLLDSTSCPKSVLRLSAAAILRTFPPGNSQEQRRPAQFDPLRQVAMQALGLPHEGGPIPFALSTGRVDGSEYVAQAIRAALPSATTTKKAPSLDIDRCLLLITPTKFLHILWSELTVSSTMGHLNASRRLATHVLSSPRSSYSPPLLPIFLHIVLPNLIASADLLIPTERAMATEQLCEVVSSALTAALCVEWALLSVCKEERRLALGQPALAMARRLSADLRRKTNSPSSTDIVHRLASSTAFMANFPTFMAEL